MKTDVQKYLAHAFPRLWQGLTAALIACLAIIAIQVSPRAANAQDPRKNVTSAKSGEVQRIEREGVAVEFSIEAAGGAKGKSANLLAGTEATITFKITDANARTPLSNLRPAAWIDLRDAGTTTDAKACREKIQSLLQASFSRRATIDLNSYFILTLNHDATISVIDPLSGFGGSKLYTLVALASSGEDWVMSSDRRRLYVSMPATGQVAVVDTASWKVVTNIPAGTNPSRLALQNDGKYLWVGNDASNADSGVTVIDTTTLRVVNWMPTGLGHHEIVLSSDDRSAFVTNKQSGTVSVVDVRRLARNRDLKVGAHPVSLAFSSLSQAIYVASEGDGSISAFSQTSFASLARMETAPGIRTVRVTPDGRYAFAANQSNGLVYIFDLSTHRLAHTVPAGPKPDQITFTDQFAYVRSGGSEFVTLINLPSLNKEAAVSRFPAGQHAPQESESKSMGEAIVPAPEAGAVLVANPADKMIYFYTEGMAAPMGSFQNYRRVPRAILVLNNSLREMQPGVYTTTVRLTAAGQYDVPFLLDTPRVVNCFSISIAENPDKPKEQMVPVKVELLSDQAGLKAGKNYQLRFRVTSATTNQPMADLKDVGVLVFLAPGIWQQREWATSLGKGVYQMDFVPPQAGVYYLFFRVPSLNVQFNQLPSVTLNATKDDSPQ